MCILWIIRKFIRSMPLNVTLNMYIPHHRYYFRHCVRDTENWFNQLKKTAETEQIKMSLIDGESPVTSYSSSDIILREHKRLQTTAKCVFVFHQTFYVDVTQMDCYSCSNTLMLDAKISKIRVAGRKKHANKRVRRLFRWQNNITLHSN